MSTGEHNLVEGNKAYAESFTQGDLALPPSQKYAVCMCPPTMNAFAIFDLHALQ